VQKGIKEERMTRTSMLLGLSLAALTGCSTAAVESDASIPPPPPGTEAAIVPAGTQVQVELAEEINANEDDVGDTFTAVVTEDVSVNGEVLVPAGSEVMGRITGLDDSDHAGDQAAVRVAFSTIAINGRTHEFNAEVTDVDVSTTDRARTDDVQEKAAVGAAAGAVLGAVIGGSLKDILVGGVLGAGTGTIISLGLGEVAATLPEGTELTLRSTTRVAMR
jgi:hypothetical protein